MAPTMAGPHKTEQEYKNGTQQHLHHYRKSEKVPFSVADTLKKASPLQLYKYLSNLFLGWVPRWVNLYTSSLREDFPFPIACDFLTLNPIDFWSETHCGLIPPVMWVPLTLQGQAPYYEIPSWELGHHWLGRGFFWDKFSTSPTCLDMAF